MRVLVAPLGPGGHLLPLLPFALALRAAGHAVAFAPPPAAKPPLREAGFPTFPVPAIVPLDAAAQRLGVETREWPDDFGAGAFGALPERPLRCPACGDPYVHPVEVRVYESTEDGGSGTVVPAGGGPAVRRSSEPGARPFGFRGATVELGAWCEQAPQVGIVLRQEDPGAPRRGRGALRCPRRRRDWPAPPPGRAR